MTKKHMIIPIFIPHKGCPFDCIYCNQKAISGQAEEMSEQKMREIIEANLNTVPQGVYREIGFFGGSFTGIDKDQQIRFLEIANEYIRKGEVREIRLSTRPDYINPDILAYLKEYHVKTIELGVQSLDEEVLANSCRGHTVNDVINASKLIRESGLNLGIQTMIGLPGDNRDKALETAKKVLDLKPVIVRIYPTLVIKGTYLEKLYLQDKYKPQRLDDAVEICAELLDLYESRNIKVIRVGLQPTDNMNENMDVVAGPFHPAFRQLVESKRVLRQLEEILSKEDFTGKKEIVIYSPAPNISNIVGQKRENINNLKKKYGFSSIKIKPENGLKHHLRVEAF